MWPVNRTPPPPPPFTFPPYRRLSTLPSNQLAKLQSAEFSSLRKHPFLLALRRWGRYVPSGEERGATDVFAG